MKKLIVILICLCLLCGCGAHQEQTPTQTPEQTEAPTQEALVSLYDADNELEEQTSGAVRVYPLGDGLYTDLVSFGDKLMVVSAGGDITLLQGQEGQIVATEATDLIRLETGLPIWVGEQNAAYYVQQTGEVVLMNGNLLEIARIKMPADAQGTPVVALLRNEIFYCVAEQIRAMDIQTGISRLVRSHSCAQQQLTGSYFNDTIIGCQITDEQGVQKAVYLYAQTGEVVAEDMTLGTLYTSEMDYFARRSDATQTQLLFGSAESETMCLDVQVDGMIPALSLGGAVRYAADETGLSLSFYDFASGTHSAQISLPGLTEPMSLVADGSALWFIIDQMLYRWDPALSPTNDETICISQLYTRENPDVRGLEQIVNRAKELSAYGVELLTWTDAVAETGGYKCESEYRVSSTEKALDDIEQILKSLPEAFLTTTGNIQVRLVRSVEDGQEPALFWQGSTCCVLLPAENAAEGFLWGLGCTIDARVLGNSRELDGWNNLNPRSFEYTYDYEKNAARENAEDYLDHFVDVAAMSYPTEDRARVFMAAMLPDNAELFEKDTLQDKLERLCKGIREAYNAEEDTTVFPWEQYLEEPLAPEED